jgi:hypothetical protein
MATRRGAQFSDVRAVSRLGDLRRSLRLPFLAALLHLAEYAAVFSAHDSVGFRQVPPPDCGVAGGNKPN